MGRCGAFEEIHGDENTMSPTMPLTWHGGIKTCHQQSELNELQYSLHSAVTAIKKEIIM